MEGYVPDGFNTSVVTTLIKNATLPVDDLKKNMVLYLSSVLYQNWLNEWLQSSC